MEMHKRTSLENLEADTFSREAGAVPAQERLQSLLETLRETLGCDRISVSLNNADAVGLHMRSLAEAGDRFPGVPETGPRVPGAVFHPHLGQMREPLVCQDLNDPPGGMPSPQILHRAGYRSAAHLPFEVQGRPAGTVNMASRQRGFFTPDKLRPVEEAIESIAAIAQHVALLRWHRNQSHFLGITQELIEGLSGSARTRETCEYLARHMTEILDVDRVSAYLLNEDAAWVTCEAVHDRGVGPEGDAQLLPSLRIESTAFLPDVLRGNPISLLEPHRHLVLPEKVAAGLTIEEMRSLLLVPLMRGESPVGVLFCQRREPVAIVLEDALGSIRLLGQQIGLTLHNRQIVENHERSARNFAELVDMSHAVSSTADLSQVPEMVARRARDLCEADESTLFLSEPDGQHLRPVTCLGAYAEQVMKVRIKIGQGITGTVAARRRGEVINRAEVDPRSVQIPGTPLEPEAILAVPLVSADRLVGVLTLHKLEGRVFNPVDLDTVEIFSTQAAIALENARLFSQMRDERTRLVAMLQNMQEGVVLAGAGGAVILMNEASRRMLDIGTDDRVGDPVLDLLPDPDFTVVRDALDRVRRGGERNVTQEYCIRGRTHLCSVSAVRDEEEGASAGEVLLFKDVTDLKEIEAQLLQSSKMSAVGQLAAGVAHEFNNLIASIYGYAQLMKGSTDPQKIQKGVGIILKSSERARELTSSLLAFSRRRPGRREPVDVNQILTDTLLLLNRQLEKANVRVDRDLGRIPLTVADPGRLQEVFLNLLINARQAMSEGGRLTVSTRVEAGNIEVRVEDEGSGIRPEHLARIFEPFFTTKGPLSGARTPGTGLGLSTSYNVVRDHGGSIHAASRLGEGSAFTVTLPVRSLHERPSEEATEGPRPPRSLDATGRVLLLDDDPALGELVREILEGLGHQVERAGDADRAENLLDVWQADLLILDQSQAAPANLQAYRNFRDKHRELPMVLITSQDAAKALEAEGDPWVFRINKPFRNRDLVALVSRILAQSLRRAG